jgi:hypothetical protein
MDPPAQNSWKPGLNPIQLGTHGNGPDRTRPKPTRPDLRIICLNRTPPTRAQSPHPPLLSRLPLLDRIHPAPAQRSRLPPTASASPPPHLDSIRPAALLRSRGDAAALLLRRHAEHELQRRRHKPLAPRSSTAKRKRPSAPPLTREGDRYTGREPGSRPPNQEDPSPTASKPPPGSAGTHAEPRPRPHPSPVRTPCTPPPSRSAPS